VLDIPAVMRPNGPHGGAVGQDFGGAAGGAKIRRVVAHGDHCIGADLRRVLHHALEGMLPCGFARLGIRLDVAADDLLEAAGQALHHRRRTHHDAADDSEILHDLVAGNVISSRYEHALNSV
jgi:hypothetical protein